MKDPEVLTIRPDIGVAVTNINHDIDVERSSAGQAEPNRLYRNDGSAFVDIAPQFAGMADSLSSMSGIWGDYDLDGDVDLFVDGGHSNQLFRNDNAFLVNVAAEEGLIDSTNTARTSRSFG